MKDKVGGKVLTQFVVDTSGNVTDIKVLEGMRPDIDEEPVRLIGLLNGWTPGFQNGEKVKVRYVLPLTFLPIDEGNNEVKGAKHSSCDGNDNNIIPLAIL